jgi:YbbR domain-containing protein
MLFMVACEGSKGPSPGPEASSVTGLSSGERCPAIAYVTLSISVSDKATGSAVCDAEVEVVDEAGRALALRRAGDGCALVTYEGHAGSFEVRARKSGYSDASKQTLMQKLPCQLSAPAVHLQLERSH